MNMKRVLAVVALMAWLSGAAWGEVAPAGWYAGDMHVHRNCGPSTSTNSVSEIFNQMTNADLSVVSLLADMGNGEVADPTTDLPLVNGQDDLDLNGWPDSTLGRGVALGRNLHAISKSSPGRSHGGPRID